VSAVLPSRPALAAVIGLVTLLAFGCVVPEGGGYAPGIGADYYEPYGTYYGGWEPGYEVGPWRDGGHRPDAGRGGGASHAFRPAAVGRAMPSIPSGSRGGGHGGGGRR
jgi:hypothetical protein